MLRSVIVALVLASGATHATSAAGLHRMTDTSGNDMAFTLAAVKLSGKQQLQKLLQPHFGRIPVTREAKAAAGNPNMPVFDRRRGFANFSDDVYRCSFITYRKARAMVCD